MAAIKSPPPKSSLMDILWDIQKKRRYIAPDDITKIANEFSSFAKMPNPNKETVELIQLINSVKELFSDTDGSIISIETFLFPFSMSEM